MMDYIERRRRRLENDHRRWLRDYKRALSRTWILRDRLAHLPLAALEGERGISSLASTLSAVAERAAWLRRRTCKAQGRLKVFDPDSQRRSNADVDGHCRFLNKDGIHCGHPTVDGSRWCARHVNLWDDHDPWGGHVVGWWREVRLEHTATGTYARLTPPMPVSRNTLVDTIVGSRWHLSGDLYETDDLCTREDIERWTTVPGEYDPETER